MVEESVVARPAEARVSTGNPALDAMLEGGLVARRPYLIVGPSGTGKTTLGIQFLCDGVRRGERVLLVTLEEPPNEARVNHRGLGPDLDRVEVFDAIPDIMRYERAPFKDIASVRSAVPFGRVPLEIRRSPELASVEVTITALEQMLRTEVIRKNYTRLVIDSLTALQYFCMKGFDPVAGAQSFLRFLSDLRVTTILTVEAPLEDVETPERMLARGEIRLFRWELDGQTVRAVGVEKFRGSSHDVRLHPYRIGPQGIDINLEVTISRDTRQIIGPIVRHAVAPTAATAAVPFVSSVTPLMEEVRDLILLGADVAPARTEIEAALEATSAGKLDQAQAHLSRMSSLVVGWVDTLSQRAGPTVPADPGSAAALQRVLARADSVRTGVPPTSLPPQPVLEVQLGALLSLLPAPPPARPEEAPPATVTPVGVSAPLPVPSPVSEAPGEKLGVAEPPAPAPTVPPSSPMPVPAAPEPAAVARGGPSPGPEFAGETPVSEGTPTSSEIAAPAYPIPAKLLPPPPKPRSSVTGPRVPKSAAPPSPRRVSRKEEPPPLPTAAMPDWLTPPLLPGPEKVPHPAAQPPVVSPPPQSGTPPVRESPPAARKRRKPTPAATGKKVPTAPRAAVPHPTLPVAPVGLPHAANETPGPLKVGTPPTLPHAAEPSPKPRRRAPRKRKAPPVVAVEVEPTPAHDIDKEDEESAPREGPRSPTPPEG